MAEFITSESYHLLRRLSIVFSAVLRKYSERAAPSRMIQTVDFIHFF